MTDAIEAITTSALRLALDAATLRQQAIASNIANADTAGYVRQTTSFERQVEQLRQAWRAQGTPEASLFSNVQVRIEPDLNQPTGVQLDTEVAQMAQNTAHYQALLKGLSRHYAILSIACSDGKK